MSFLLSLWEYILVFLLAAIPWIEIAAVIPLAILKGLNPFAVAILSFLGNLATVYLLIIYFEKYLSWREARKKDEEKNQKDLSGRLEYGISMVCLVYAYWGPYS